MIQRVLLRVRQDRSPQEERHREEGHHHAGGEEGDQPSLKRPREPRKAVARFPFPRRDGAPEEKKPDDHVEKHDARDQQGRGQETIENVGTRHGDELVAVGSGADLSPELLAPVREMGLDRARLPAQSFLDRGRKRRTLLPWFGIAPVGEQDRTGRRCGREDAGLSQDEAPVHLDAGRQRIP